MRFENLFKNLTGIALSIGMSTTALMMATSANAVVVSFETDEAGFISVGTGGGLQTGGIPQGPFAVGNRTFTLDADTFEGSVPGNITFNNESNIEITQNSEGIGIDNNNGRGGGDNSDIDGDNDNDIFIFTFNTEVRLEELIFENVSNNDDFTLFIPSADPTAQVFDIINPLAIPDTNGDEGFFSFGDEGRLVTSFGIGARGSNDDFRLSRISVQAVPIPAALPLMAGGLGLLGFVGWRKRKSS